MFTGFTQDRLRIFSRYGSVVKLKKGEKEVPFKGVMGIMALGAKQGDTVTFSFDGPDEAEELEAVKAFMEANL